MPRVSREQTELNRAAIEAASSKLFRERGIQQVSLADLMAEAGLTHGGFYGHFESKDALVASVVTNTFAASEQRWRDRVAKAGNAEDGFAVIADHYLAKGSRDKPGSSCPATTLAMDVAREPAGAPIHDAFLQGLESLVSVLTDLHDSGDKAEDRAQALAEMALMAGAQALARATKGHAVSNEILEAARSYLSTNRVQ